MSAQLIYDLVPLGSLVTYSDGTPRPPERHRKKLAAWENRNSGGRLIRKHAETRVGNTTLPATITLHKGDYGSQGTIVLRVHQTFSVNSELKFAVTERPGNGSVLVLHRAGDDAELVYVAAIERRPRNGSRGTATRMPFCRRSRPTPLPPIPPRGGQRHERVNFPKARR